MSHRPFILRASLLLAATATVAFITLGGCPQAQQPTSGNENVNDNTSNTSNGNNQRTEQRPVPPIPVDNDNDNSGGSGGSSGGGGGGGGGNTNGGNVNTNGGDGTARLAVTVSSPASNREVLRNQPVDVDYRVDGSATEIELVFSKDGADVQVSQSGLSNEGTVSFSTLTPGVYQLGIRAANATGDVELKLAGGDITVVGDMDVTVIQPDQDRIVRPGVPIPISYDIKTLAKSVSVSIFIDPDRNTDGDESLQFTSTLKADSKNIQSQNLALNQTYSVYLESTDSLGQTTGRIYAAHIIRVVPAPSINVTAPSDTQTIQAGDTVTVQFTGVDTEGLATITVFVDTDGVFNGDEDAVVSDLSISTTSADINTASFLPGTYYFGAWVADPNTGDVLDHDYAQGTRVIPGITISAPASDQSVRAPTAVRVQWSAVYPQAQFPTHELIVAVDANNDRQPDGTPLVAAAGFSPGSNTVNLSTLGLKGRYMVGIRLTDTVGGTLVNWAAGEIVVDNNAPNVSIQAPTAAVGVRPNTPEASIIMTFTATDTEQTALVEVVVARDDNQDGDPDGPPVFVESNSQLRLGLTPRYIFDATQLDDAGLIDDATHDGFGHFLLGVRVTDDAGQTKTAWATGGLYLDSVEPAIELLDPIVNVTRDAQGDLSVTLRVTDTSPTMVALILDLDFNLFNPLGDGYELIALADTPESNFAANEERTITFNLENVPPGFYFWHLAVFDGAETAVQHFVPKTAQNTSQAQRLWIRDRLIGTFNVASLENSDPNKPSKGAILQGFNFNDLAGSSMTSVPDVEGDGDDEFVVVSRFGKPYIINNSIGVGFGEAYMVYGRDGNDFNPPPANKVRLRNAQTLNAVGRGTIKGLSFPGIRIPFSKTWTEGIADVTVIDDMDGDENSLEKPIPELVFTFPRVESLNLGAPAFVNGVSYQHPELVPDISGMGTLEYDAINYMTGAWTKDQAQFTRGGIVIVSSHNRNYTVDNDLNRKGDRVIDLHEVGQMFTDMSAPSLVPYPISFQPDNPPGGCGFCPGPDDQGTDCNGDGTVGEFTDSNMDGTWGGSAAERVDYDMDGTKGEFYENEYSAWLVGWDSVFAWNGQGRSHGPGGFHMPWTEVPADPPLANPAIHPPFPPYIFYPDTTYCDDLNGDGVPDGCQVTNLPIIWFPQPLGPFPCSSLNSVIMWDVGGGVSHWTGFYGSNSPEVSIREYSIGARVLGQSVDDRFGTSVSSDGNWLYISAPRHTALRADVPALPADLSKAGVVYQYRTNSRAAVGSPTRSQLWMERFDYDTNNDGVNDTTAAWPVVDREPADIGTDTTMPVPHQYIIETIGSTRGDTTGAIYNVLENSTCPPAYPATTGGAQAPAASGCFQPYAVGTAGYYMDRVSQIVGPHKDAKISYVRGLGDVNDDGIRDFAVGSPDIKASFVGHPQTPTGDTVGAIFIVYSRATGLEGDYLLEDVARDPADPKRIAGVYVKGVAGEPIARVFDTIGVDDKNLDNAVDDFNGDGVADVIIGSSGNALNRGQAVLIYGSRTLISPADGYTLDQLVLENRAIRFVGAHDGDLAGANVSSAGDIDGDGFGDIMIAAPGASIDGALPKPGLVYLVYGSNLYQSGQVIDLSLVGTPAVPGVVFVGRNNGDFMGGGELTMTVNPDNQPTQIFSRGLVALGDIDKDGLGDYAISAILADPAQKTNAGEVYILYGRGDQPTVP